MCLYAFSHDLEAGLFPLLSVPSSTSSNLPPVRLATRSSTLSAWATRGPLCSLRSTGRGSGDALVSSRREGGKERVVRRGREGGRVGGWWVDFLGHLRYCAKHFLGDLELHSLEALRLFLSLSRSLALSLFLSHSLRSLCSTQRYVSPGSHCTELSHPGL